MRAIPKLVSALLNNIYSCAIIFAYGPTFDITFAADLPVQYL